MKTIVLQFGSGKYRDLLEVSREAHLDACRKYGYAYRCEYSHSTKDPFWHKLVMVNRAMREGYEFIAWIDSDCIWNGSRPLHEAMHEDGIGIVRFPKSHWYPEHWCCGVYFVRATTDRNRVQSMLDLWSRTRSEQYPHCDQHAFNKLTDSGQLVPVSVGTEWHNFSDSAIVRCWHGMHERMPGMHEHASKIHLFPVVHRRGSHDEQIWTTVRTKNEYGLQDAWTGDVIDIGAHIGSFSTMAVSLGARKVIAVEPSAENFRLLEFNCDDLIRDGRVLALHAACSSTEGKMKSGGDTWPNTGGINFNLSPDGEVITVSLESLLDFCEGPVLLKLDCEGAEFDIVCNSDLSKVGAIVGEYHEGNLRVVDHLICALIEKGFKHSVNGVRPIGLFAAHREQNPS